MKTKISIILILLINFEIKSEDLKSEFSIMFYNVENLFDTLNNPQTNDDEFTPQGLKKWTSYRYHKKLNSLAAVISSIKSWETPSIICLAEVENRVVVEQLRTICNLNHYKIIHKESVDKRGIDLSILYNPEFVNLNGFKFIHTQKFSTRYILYFNCTVETENYHLFVNHWPSRWGGASRSEPRRIEMAHLLKTELDSILNFSFHANIIVCGDFNDYADNKSIEQVLKVNSTDIQAPSMLYNLSTLNTNNAQTSKYKNIWRSIDHMIVSKNMLNFVGVENAEVYAPDFLLEKDFKYGGEKPYRTFNGMRYNGGYSDHLPLVLTVKLK